MTNVLTLAKNPAVGGDKKVVDLLKDFDAVLQIQNAGERKEVIELEQRLAAEGFSNPYSLITPVEPATVKLKSKINGAFVTVTVNAKGQAALEKCGLFVINPAVRSCAKQGYTREL